MTYSGQSSHSCPAPARRRVQWPCRRLLARDQERRRLIQVLRALAEAYYIGKRTQQDAPYTSLAAVVLETSVSGANSKMCCSERLPRHSKPHCLQFPITCRHRASHFFASFPCFFSIVYTVLGFLTWACGHQAPHSKMRLQEVVLCSAAPSTSTSGAGAIALHDISTGSTLASFKQTSPAVQCTAVVNTTVLDGTPQGGLILTSQPDKSILNVYNFQKVRCVSATSLRLLRCLTADLRYCFWHEGPNSPQDCASGETIMHFG